MSSKASTLGGDVGAWAFNVTTSVAIVFCNKALMDPKWGFKFVFGEAGCHACTNALCHSLGFTCSDDLVRIAFLLLCDSRQEHGVLGD
jgi:hypothetical protein